MNYLFSDSSDFQSVDTDPEQTNYDLESSQNQPSTSKAAAAAMTRRSPAKVAKKTLPLAKKQTLKAKKAKTPQPPPPPSSDSSEEEEQSVNESRTTRNSSRQQQEQQPNTAAANKSRRRRKQAMPEKSKPGYTGTQIPRLPFARLVHSFLVNDRRSQNFRVTRDALEALQLASEIYLSGVLGDAYQITLSRKQVTLLPRDINILMYLRGPGSKLGCA